jgi:GH43 family beta-xylosidase
MAEDFASKYYLNPVYSKSFPDPFVLKYRGLYYAYCTDFWTDGQVFGVLRSKDLINWEERGGAMFPLENGPPFYWAPEVTYFNGKFYLYYSAGNETLMELRVAVSDRPDGDFIDSGKRLTREEFAIDAHLFADHDGQKYLFYATDFLEHTHIGTGTVVDRMIDFFTLEGNPRPVTRARYDWQVYDPDRKEKGGVRWHTVEGSFVLKRKGIYYQMYSGGNWQNVTYGVSFAATEDIEKNEEWEQFSDGEKVLPILRTVPGMVTGPGHNSVVRGLNNRELFCVYHCWTENGRALAIDRMDFTGGARMFVLGATTSPQPFPYQPQILDFFDELSVQNWQIISGEWLTKDNQAQCQSAESAQLKCQHQGKNFLFEISLRLVEETNGRFGIYLTDKKTNVCRFLLEPNEKRVQTGWLENDLLKIEEFNLPADFDFRAFHLLRVEIDYQNVKISLDEQVMIFQRNLKDHDLNISLAAENCQAAFSGAALTGGFENLFEENDLAERGWRFSGIDNWKIKDKNLIVTSQGLNKTFFEKDFCAENYELTFNFCLIETFDEHFEFGLRLGSDEEEQISFTFIKKTDNNWLLQLETFGNLVQIPLGEDFSLDFFRQFCFLKIADELTLRSETKNIGTIKYPHPSSKITFFVQNAAAAFDLIRLTAL